MALSGCSQCLARPVRREFEAGIRDIGCHKFLGRRRAKRFGHEIRFDATRIAL